MNLATLDGEVYYYKSFYPRLKATALFNEFFILQRIQTEENQTFWQEI